MLFDKKVHVSYPFLVILSLVMAFVANLRFNGMYVVLLSLIILSVYLFKNNKSDKLYAVVPVLTIIFILLFSSVNVIYDVDTSHIDFARDKVCHMLADYDLNLELEQKDKELLHELMDEKDIKDNYIITYKDPLRNNAINNDAWTKNKDKYIEMAIHYSLKNPGHCIKYILGSMPMMWDISSNHTGHAYFTDISKPKDSFYDYIGDSPLTNYDNPTAKNVGTAKYDGFVTFVEYFEYNVVLDKLFNNSPLYMYLSFIVMIGIYLITKSKSIFLVYVPNILNIFIVSISAPSQDVRYLYANFLIFYFLVIALIGCLTEYGFKYDGSSVSKDSSKKRNEK